MPGPLSEMNGHPAQFPTTWASPPPSEWPTSEIGRPLAIDFAQFTMSNAPPAMFGMTLTAIRTFAVFCDIGAVFSEPLVPENPTMTSVWFVNTPPWNPLPYQVAYSNFWVSNPFTVGAESDFLA